MAHTALTNLLVRSDANTVSSHIRVADFVRGSIGPLPTGTVATTVTFEVANVKDDPADGDFKTAADSAGADIAGVATQAAGDVIAIPDAVFSYTFLRLKFSAAQTGATAAAPLKIPIHLQGDT